MTDEELIARLRSNIFGTGTTMLASDRIEQLVATNEALTKERNKWRRAAETRDEGWKISDDARIEAEAKLAENEARLGKAVEALDGLLRHEPDYSDTLWQEARATLAEIKGESHD